MPTAVPILPPPLREGDRLTGEEFLRRWEAMPDLKRAELLDGVVHMPSPVSHLHNAIHPLLSAWLVEYMKVTPGCQAGIDGTWLMSPTTIPQPDLTLRLLPECGGQSSVVNEYLAGSPELAIEISHSTSARDLGPKGQLYLAHGVPEYLVVLTKKPDVIWREVAGGRYRRIPAGTDGIFRSRIFPGLWLDPKALWNLDPVSLSAALSRGIAAPEHAAFLKHLSRQ